MTQLKRAHRFLTIVILSISIISCSTVGEQDITHADSTTEVILTATDSPDSTTVHVSNSRYHEAPMLTERVANGDLPPVEERLPDNPRVIPVYEEIGQYGGTLRRAYTGISDRWGPTKLIEERIIEYYMSDSDTLSIELNWADQFEANADSSEYTVHIREGLRWSDGVAVTTEDVRFWYEDVLMNEDFFPTIHPGLIINDEPVVIDIVDSYTFVIKFAGPYPLFPTIVAGETPGYIGIQGTSFILPSHYLKDYHPDYTPREELDDIAEDYGVENWIDLWNEGPIQSWWLNPDLPVLLAWKIVVPPPANQVIMERNPYYHAVDAEGNQLPYIDTIVHDLAEQHDVIHLWAIQGLIDLQSRHMDIGNYNLFSRNQEQGDYRLVTWQGGQTDSLFPNLTTPDAVLADLFNDIRFRQALSIAIDRQEILTIVYSDLGEARQASPVSGSPQFDAEFERRWTEYDPDTANDLLDEIGLTEYNDDGFRLRPDNEVLSITISATAQDIMMGLIQDYWADIGIQVNVDMISRQEYEARAESGAIEVGFWNFDRSVIIAADPGQYLGTTLHGPWASLYSQWYDTNGTDGVEPPADHPIYGVWSAWESAVSAPDIDIANEFIQEMISIHRDNIWVIGIVGEYPALYIVNNNIRNFPEGLIHENSLRDIGLAQPVQFFFADTP